MKLRAFLFNLFEDLTVMMAPKPKQTTASLSVAAAPTTVGGFSSQKTPIFGKWNSFHH